MANTLTLLFLASSAALLVLLFTYLPRWQQLSLSLSLVAFLSLFTLATAQPAFAAAANDAVLSDEQSALQETLKTTPGGSQYQGIEYAQEKGAAVSDIAITRKVDSIVPSSLSLSVSNGSVRLSGKVENREAAQDIVQQVKEVEGVQQVAYDLGLQHQ